MRVREMRLRRPTASVTAVLASGNKCLSKFFAAGGMSWYFWRGFKNFFGMKAISRTILSFWSVCVAACILPSCSIDDEEDLVGNWVKVSDFDGVSRCSAVTFTAGAQVYVYCRKNKFTYFCRLYEKECSMDRKTLTDEVFPDCPIRNILARISDKWSLLVIYTLYESGKDNMRFKELQRDIPDISQKMLTVTLRTLETDGYVTRTVYPEVPPHVEYSLTDRAHSLLPHVNALIDWASEHRDEIMEDRMKASGGGQ